MSTASVLHESGKFYEVDGEQYARVTDVIHAVWSKSWEGRASESVVQNAADRGKELDYWVGEEMKAGWTLAIPPGIRDDVSKDLDAVYDWFCATKPKYLAHQIAVSDRMQKTAGTIDLLVSINDRPVIVDLKRTANVEKLAWVWQIGGYAHLYSTTHMGVLPGGMILHVNPKFAKGYIGRPMDTPSAVCYWRNCYQIWKDMQEITAWYGLRA